MALNRNVGWQGWRYQGGLPMLSWRLHRWSGIGIIVFVGLHLLASLTTQAFGSTPIANGINTIYESVYFQLLVVYIVYFHALNGLRVILLDLFPRFLEYQREITWAQWLVFIPLYILSAFVMLMAHFNAG